MSEPYEIKCKKIKLKELENFFEKLQKDYEDVARQRNHTTNAQEINKLERQLDTILKNLERVGLECNQLQKEIQELEANELATAVPKTLQALIDLLAPIDFETVTKAYRACLSAGRLRPVPETLGTLVRQLREIPGDPNEPEPLLHFVSLLIQEPSLENEQREPLESWAKTQGLSVQEQIAEQIETAEICLMVKVKPRALNDPFLGYLVSAALVADSSPFRPELELVSKPIPISVPPDPKYAPGYSQDDLPHILNELITTCGNEHGVPLTELIIQCFLPIELMSLPVEHWQFQIGRKQQEYSGRRCKAVIVRSSDRHFSSDYQLASGDWKKYWNRLLTIQQSQCSKALVHIDPIIGKTRINWKSSKVVGCRFVEHDNPQQRENLWDELLSQGTPIAMWIRQPTTKKKMQSLSTCTIAELSTSLAEHRQRALSHDCEVARLEAACLCLLFDNPYRPFPTIDYQSA
ncbi:hypothetical protein [Trichocoleus desertorum]|uniref:VMAP-C domain-containing protein n=1 Tax=Trichocoleus desertorum TaxID=1481672 RepID=UPI0018EFBB3B